MAKDTFYFSHDYNARNDDKVKLLIRKHGLEGYGIFWAIIEDLYNNNNSMRIDYEGIAYELRVQESKVKSIINDFELFTVNETHFGSHSIERRIDERDAKSKKARLNANKRWGVDESRVTSSVCTFYVIEMRKDDEVFIKCGITSVGVSRRFSSKTNGYQYTVLLSFEIRLDKGLLLETQISEKCKSYLPKDNFGGYLECYLLSEKDEILKMAMLCECHGNAINKGKEIKEEEEIKETPPMQKNDSENWNTMPHPSDVSDIPEIKLQSAKELLKITRQVDVSAERIIGMWSVFKIQNLTGKKYYQDVGAVHSHFINWIKTQKFEASQFPVKRTGLSPAEIKAQRILNNQD